MARDPLEGMKLRKIDQTVHTKFLVLLRCLAKTKKAFFHFIVSICFLGFYGVPGLVHLSPGGSQVQIIIGKLLRESGSWSNRDTFLVDGRGDGQGLEEWCDNKTETNSFLFRWHVFVVDNQNRPQTSRELLSFFHDNCNPDLVSECPSITRGHA